MVPLRETRNGVMLKIRVSPGRKKFEIRGFDSWSGALLLSTREPAERGKANKEIERELGKLFGTDARISKGHKSREKEIEVNASLQSIRRVLEKLIV